MGSLLLDTESIHMAPREVKQQAWWALEADIDIAVGYFMDALERHQTDICLPLRLSQRTNRPQCTTSNTKKKTCRVG